MLAVENADLFSSSCCVQLVSSFTPIEFRHCCFFLFWGAGSNNPPPPHHHLHAGWQAVVVKLFCFKIFASLCVSPSVVGRPPHSSPRQKRRREIVEAREVVSPHCFSLCCVAAN